jgi:hypothetical protein
LTRDQNLIQIRPILSDQNDAALEEDMAQFQLHTLRPILKFQHEFFVKLAEEKLIARHSDWKNHVDQKKRELISSWISLDLETKKTVEGSIISFFTLAELDFYFKNEKEIQKRIRAFLIERLRLALV